MPLFAFRKSTAGFFVLSTQFSFLVSKLLHRLLKILLSSSQLGIDFSPLFHECM